ncbi:MAG: elongation factor 4 [Desulfobacca sp. 4484_104]|nr:MAG: elongation factor 4 [Desulfobacca sp. 4484_104]
MPERPGSIFTVNSAKIRNFSIIAHIDHGKSTLADRLLEATGTISAREMRDQFLDRMDLERERGITIKAAAVRMRYQANDSQEYLLNLIDTPGHVDFSYEVSRSLAASDGALLIIDAAQGIEAQTLANVYLALENNLEIIPVINKCDLANADPEGVEQEIQEIIGLDASGSIRASAKTGQGIADILETIVTRVPPPSGQLDAPLKMLIFDSWFDPYHGAIVMVRVIDGQLRPGMPIQLMATGKIFEVTRIGVFAPDPTPVNSLSVGEVGFLSANIKNLADAMIGDTITGADNPTPQPFPGFKKIKPMVFSGFYPVEAGQFGQLKEALNKLRLNDASFTFEPESSAALGFGFRLGFLGLLHLEIVKERLEREFGLNLLATAPTVVYRVITTKGEELWVDNPLKLPPWTNIDHLEEPQLRVEIFTPAEYLGNILKLCEEKRGRQLEVRFFPHQKVLAVYELPLNEMVVDFYDSLKSLSRGYASMDYDWIGYRTAPLVQMDLLVNGKAVDALSVIVHKDKAYRWGRELTGRLKEIIPRQMFEVVIQAAIGCRVIARERIPPLRKQVTAKCYGGDITRKRKLLEQQKEGKKKMKQIGQIHIPSEAFLAMFGMRG